MKTLIILNLLLSTQLHAELKKFDSKPEVQTTIKLDINNDGKIDRIEHRIGDRITKLEEDKDFKGKINQWTSYFPYRSVKEPVEVSEIDTNYDGRVDRKNLVYQDLEHKLRITTTEVDADHNGSFEKVFTTHADLTEKKEQFDCADGLPHIDGLLNSLMSDSTKASEDLFVGNFLKTNFGYDIQKSCMGKWGKGFPNILKDAIGTGLACMQALAKTNAENKVSPNGVANNLTNLKHLLENQRVTITCDQKTTYDWSTAIAHASITSADELKDDGIKHPYMSINPNEPKKSGNATKEDIIELKKTLFHEQLHNLGIRHHEGIEISYTCETCCIGEDDPKKAKEKSIACKICGSGYKDKNDKEYLKDYVIWGKESYKKDRVSAAIMDYQKEFPQDRFALMAYVELNSGSFSPVALQVSKIFKKKFPNLTEEEKIKLEDLNYIDNEKGLQKPHIIKYSQIIANAYITRYFDNNPEAAFAVLKTNKNMIKDLDRKIASAKKDEDKWILEDIRSKYIDLVKDVWLQRYPAELEESGEAYNLLGELNYFKTK